MERPSARQAISSNRDAWNESAQYHRDTDDWQALLGAVGNGDFSRLDPTLTGLLLQADIKGKDVVQLGCNNGRESLSLFSLGARSVTGVDQSGAFLAQARELSAASPHDPEFIEADIHHLPEALLGRFDVALITIGVLGWMPDVGLFMAHAASTLKPGGALLIYETHPFLEMFDPKAINPMLPASSYFRQEPFVLREAIVYEGEAAGVESTSYWYVHSMGDIINGAIKVGLQISEFTEYPHSNREELYDQYQHQPAQLPMCYALAATRRGGVA